MRSGSSGWNNDASPERRAASSSLIPMNIVARAGSPARADFHILQQFIGRTLNWL
jgi:hypothetical protein